jgi:lysophospholipase L1-like esterase
MSHVALLGDSIFDNQVYVGSGPDVVHQLRERLPHGWKATLLAVDGDTTQGVPTQLASLPQDATHLIVSAGGNDALMQAGILVQSVVSVAETMCRMADVVAHFEASYRRMLDALLKHDLPTAVCTIYDPRFDEPMQQKVAVAGLCHFNDVILRCAIERGLPVLDLRLICNEYSDYANEIEPGVPGGAKIAAAVARLVTLHDFSSGRTSVFV